MRHALWLAVLAGCSQLPTVSKPPEAPADPKVFLPTVAFDTIELTELSWTGATSTLLFTVSNPHPVGVTVDRVDWELRVSDSRLLDGTAEGFEVAASGDSTLRLPADLDFGRLATAAATSAGQDTVPFEVIGTVTVDAPVQPLPTLPLSATGELPLLRTPDVRIAGARVASLKLLKNEAVVEVDLGITHEQGASLDLSGLDYAVSLGGAEVGTGTMSDPGAVAPGAEAIVTIPLSLDLLALGGQVVAAITDKTSIDVGLVGTVDVATPLGTLPLELDEQRSVKLK